MGATPGNKFWLLRSSHGRDKTFENKEILKESILEYFEITSERKLGKTDWVGKDAEKVMRDVHVPFTITGLCIFLGISHQTWKNYKNNDSYKDFFEVITWAEEVIYTQKFEGATVGNFNANIISNELGLKTHVEVTDNRKEIEKLFDGIEDEE